MSTRDAALSTDPVVVLSGLGFSPGIVGGKGSALDRLIESSIPVPTSGVVTTSAYRSFVDVPALHAAQRHLTHHEHKLRADVVCLGLFVCSEVVALEALSESRLMRSAL